MSIWRVIIAAMTAIIMLLAAGGAVVTWQLNWVDRRLDERLQIYFRHQEEINKRIDKNENRILELERKSK